MKRKLIKWLILVAVLGGILVLPFTNRNKVSVTNQTPIEVKAEVNYKEIIVEDLKQINKLEIMQSSMKEEVEIKAQWDNFLFTTIPPHVKEKLDTYEFIYLFKKFFT